MSLLLGALTLGFIFSFIALGVYISFRIFAFPETLPLSTKHTTSPYHFLSPFPEIPFISFFFLTFFPPELIYYHYTLYILIVFSFTLTNNPFPTISSRHFPKFPHFVFPRPN